MSKRDELYDEARRLYVVGGLSLLAIGQRLGVSERSLQTWSKDSKDGKGTWVTQRACLLGGDKELHAEVVGFAVLVVRQAKEDFLEGKIDHKLVASLDKTLKSAVRALEYMRKSPPKQDQKTPEERRQAIGGKIRETLGLQ